jgi:hypothetical protein
MRWDEEWTKSQAWGCPCHPKKHPRSTSVKAWGCPRGTPSSSAKIRSPFKTLYFYCFMHYAFFLERQLFLLLVFFCFACCNKWVDHIMLVWRETYFTFHLPRTLRFSLLSFQRVFSFSATAFSLCFSPWFLFRSCYIFSSRCIFASDLYWFSSKEVFIKGLNGVGKEKKFHAKKVVQKGACLDCGLDFCKSCLMSFW